MHKKKKCSTGHEDATLWLVTTKYGGGGNGGYYIGIIKTFNWNSVAFSTCFFLQILKGNVMCEGSLHSKQYNSKLNSVYLLFHLSP